MILEGDLNCPLEVDYQVIMQNKEFLIHKTVPTSFTVSLSEIQEYGFKLSSRSSWFLSLWLFIHFDCVWEMDFIFVDKSCKIVEMSIALAFQIAFNWWTYGYWKCTCMNMVLQYKDRLYNQSRYICKRTCRPSTFIRSAKHTGTRTVAPICSQLDIDVVFW